MQERYMEKINIFHQDLRAELQTLGIVAPKENTFNIAFLTKTLKGKVEEANRLMVVEQRSCVNAIASKIEFGMAHYYIFSSYFCNTEIDLSEMPKQLKKEEEVLQESDF